MKVWFYYAKAGGGHKAVASALASAVKQLNIGELETREIDLAERTDIFFKFFVEKVYVFLTHYAEWLYFLLYELNELKPVIRFEYALVNFLLKSSIKSRLVVDRPKAIISTFYMISPLLSALKELKMNVPILMIVTEPFTAPPVWFIYPEIKFIVFSDAAEKCALQAGVAKENIFKFPQVANHPVLNLSDEMKTEIKKNVGLTPEKKMVLMIGGANGLPRGKEVLRDMLRSEIDAEFLIVCGDNLKYQKEMNRLVGHRKNATVLGFVENISELVAASDLVITKAGAGVTWEVMLHKKPLLMTYYIYGQEQGTKDFVVKNGLGWYEPKPDRAVEKVWRFFTQPDIEAGIKEKYNKLNFRCGNEEIARFIGREFLK